MPRTPRPWYRKSKNAWFVCLDGKQVLLAKGRRNKAEAQRNYHELMLLRSAAETVEGPEATVAAVCEYYLDWCQRHRRPGTYGWYHFYLQDFAEMHGRTKAVELKPFHVTRWVDSHRWNETTANGAISSVKRALNWAVDEGLIPSHGIGKVKKPRSHRRKRVLTAEEFGWLLRESDRHFADFLLALRKTGARPGELRELLWSHVDLKQGICVLHDHKTSTRHDEPRILILCPEMQELFRRRKEQFPDSQHVFVNKLRKPWTRNAVRLRMRRLRENLNLGADVVAYSVRHTFGTAALLNGVDLKTVSELMGHRTVSTTEIYLHLAKETEHLKRAIQQATGSTPLTNGRRRGA